MELTFKIAAWDAWAPELPDAGAWKAWAQGGAGFSGLAGKAPAVAAMPPLLRRRADANDRVGLEIAYRLAAGKKIPAIWASRHGEVQRSAVLLTQLAQGEALSPMDFSLSVHNATAGLYSMAQEDRSPNASLAAGEEGLIAALLEAQGTLLEGAPEALVIIHDTAPPEEYADRWQRTLGQYGLGLRLDRDQGATLSLRVDQTEDADSELPLAVELAKLLARGQGVARSYQGGRIFEWALQP